MKKIIKDSLQKIEDQYRMMGLKESFLRKALVEDKDYQRILKERKSFLSKKFKVNKKEAKKYLLSIDRDYEILGKIYELEKKKLAQDDKRFVDFIRTQLEQDWRKPLIRLLDNLLKKYT